MLHANRHYHDFLTQKTLCEHHQGQGFLQNKHSEDSEGIHVGFKST